MALARADAVLRALAQGRRGGVFFLFGDEDLLKERLATQIVDAHLDPSTRDFNLDQLRGGELDVEKLGSVLATPPMLAEWRVVVVRDAEAIAGMPKARAVVEQLLDRRIPDLVLILLTNIPEKSTAKFYERLKKDAVAVELASLSEADLPGWLIEEASERGFELEATAARAMASAIGSDMGVLARELDKLRDYVGERKAASLKDVEVVVGVVPRQDKWAWLDLVGDGRVAEARRALPILLEAGETGVGLVIALGTHLLRLALAVNGGAKALDAELPRHQKWLAQRVMRQAPHWTPATVSAALDDLLRADRLLKSASLGETRVLDELLLRMEARGRKSVRR